MNYEDTDFTSFDAVCMRHPEVTTLNMMGGCPECFHEDGEHGPNKVWCSALCRPVVIVKAVVSAKPAHIDNDHDVLTFDDEGTLIESDLEALPDPEAMLMALAASHQITVALDTEPDLGMLFGEFLPIEAVALTSLRRSILELALKTEFRFAS